MLYRVDYAAAVLLAGLITGLLFGNRMSNVAPLKLAPAYYRLVATFLVLQSAGFVGFIVTNRQTWYTMAAFIGDFEWFSFGALFGLASRRTDRRELLLHPSVLSAITMAIAVTFALLAVGKSFAMQPMTEFFTQSGYPVGFLKFIILAEILGALTLLLPWGFLPALIGLTIDMFGAVLTHLHNRDPLNDSTDAIKMLIRLAVAGLLWAMRPRAEEHPRSIRETIVAVGAVAIACFLIAASGSAVMRLGTQSTPANASHVAK